MAERQGGATKMEGYIYRVGKGKMGWGESEGELNEALVK